MTALFSPCIKRRGCTNPQFSVHMAMVTEVVICLTPDIKCRQETWQKAKHIVEALRFQLPCMIKAIHNQKCYCFKVSLPAYTLPHIKNYFIMSHLHIIVFFPDTEPKYHAFASFFLAVSLFRYCIKCNTE